jgi:hypothetical protein
MKKINVIFRACDKVVSVNHAPRPFGLDKTTIVKACFSSLYESIRGFPHSVFVLGDSLSGELRAFFERFPVELEVQSSLGNDGSIRKTIERATSLPDGELVYFCEDDYLHQPHAFTLIHECLGYLETLGDAFRSGRTKSALARLLRKPVVLFLSDYPDRYQAEQLEPSFILGCPGSHWRQVRNVTFSFLTEVRCVKEYRSILMKSSVGARDGWLSRKLFRSKGLLCLSPMPGLTAHLHERCMSPHIDWQEIAHKALASAR